LVFLKTLLPFPMLSSRGWCLLRPPILLAVFLPFLRWLLMSLTYSGSC
jgi:hypothetical protein